MAADRCPAAAAGSTTVKVAPGPSETEMDPFSLVTDLSPARARARA